MELFGVLLRDLRSQKGIGIKQLAPELGVSYTYLSKLEHNQVRPSKELVERIAQYFRYDSTHLLLAAEKVPSDILEILRAHPVEAIALLRERFGVVDDS
ncbi:MAG: helix-turn-helix transcriptional regulator [Ktedonobacteraceae bacterium]|nr:helix-turn-helix transcriptional regulator [Ktedonobacteraceae bacterium]